MPSKAKNQMMKANRGKGRGKACVFCQQKVEPSWKEYEKLMEYLSPRGRILSAAMTGICVKHQKRLAQVIKEARHLALLPFTTIE